jgi:hypothetical protein
MKQITQCRAFQVNEVVKKGRKLRRWVVSLNLWCVCASAWCVYVCVVCICLCMCVCVYVCVCVCMMSLAALQVLFPVCLGGLVVSLYDTHEADILGRN